MVFVLFLYGADKNVVHGGQHFTETEDGIVGDEVLKKVVGLMTLGELQLQGGGLAVGVLTNEFHPLGQVADVGLSAEGDVETVLPESAAHFVDRPIDEDLPFVDEGDIITNLLHRCHVVRGENDSGALFFQFKNF